MNISAYDFILPLAMAAMFGLYRYTFYVRNNPATAVNRSAGDALKGAAGLIALTFIYKLILPQ